MRHHVAGCVVPLVLLLASAACAKLPEGAQSAPGEPAVEAVRSSDSIPLQWGELVAVTGELPVRGLWFQNDAGELRIVDFNFRTRRFGPVALVIHRK